MRRVMVAGSFAILALACGGDGSDERPDDAMLPPAPDAFMAADAGPPDSATALTDAALGDAAVSDGSAVLDAAPAEASMPRPDAGPGVPRPPDPGVINWRPCAENTRECGTMQVPLDHADPASGTIKVAVMRRRASGSRVGTLLMNPGGPGSSAIDYLGFFVEDSTSPLLDRFDLVAFDPRGVGYSVRIDCHATLQQLYAADPSPDDEREWQAASDAAARFAQDCQTAHGALLPHVGTVNVARDMDLVRAALGETKLNYLGFSYGTSIGARYAELFPQNVGALVLDAAVDLELSALDLALEQAKSFERALATYFAWCGAGMGRCSWTKGGDPASAFRALEATIEATPIAVPTADRPLGPGEFITAVTATLYGGEVGWRALSLGLERALANNGSTLLEYVDGYLQREPDGSYTNREEANQAVNCSDRKPMTLAEIRAATERFAREAPIFGLPALTGQLVCAHWPVQGTNLPLPRGAGAAPILVLGNVGDPATPYAWSQALASDLESALLLTSVAEGHTSYGRGNACIDAAVHGYLFDGVVPAENSCGTAPLSRLLFARGPAMRWRTRGR